MLNLCVINSLSTISGESIFSLKKEIEDENKILVSLLYRSFVIILSKIVTFK